MNSDKSRKNHWLDSWHVSPSVNQNYDFIDGLRGIAILMVIACHAIYAQEKPFFWHQFVLGFVGELGKGVLLFFVLSGFLISLPFWHRKAKALDPVPSGYAWRRFWKIYPPLALSVLLLTPFYIFWKGGSGLYLDAAVRWLSGVAFLYPVNGEFNPVMWSLVVEIHFYAVLPLLFWLCRRLSARTCLWLVPLVLFVVPMIIRLVTGAAPTYAPVVSDPWCTGLVFFCLGVWAGGLEGLKIWNKKWHRIGHWAWALLIVGLIGLTYFKLRGGPAGAAYGVSEMIFVLGCGGLLCYAASSTEYQVGWLCSPCLRWCGIVSYEWYLFHQPLLLWSRHFFGPAQGGYLKYACIIGVPILGSLLFAALIYRWFSLPILRFGRQRRSARKQSVA